MKLINLINFYYSEKDFVETLEGDVKIFEELVVKNKGNRFTFYILDKDRKTTVGETPYGNALVFILGFKYIVTYDLFSITFLNVLK